MKNEQDKWLFIYHWDENRVRKKYLSKYLSFHHDCDDKVEDDIIISSIEF